VVFNIYQYRDHLGNARLSFAKNSEGALEVTETNNYYPFGLNHIEGILSSSKFGSYYSYKYNSKELQETGMFDYGARFYMPDLGRWGVVDPRSQYTHETYSYVWNNPISFNDPTGISGELSGTSGPGDGDPPMKIIKIKPVVITVYRPVKLESRGFDFSSTAMLSGIAMTGSRYPNPYTLAAAGLASIILWNTPKIYQATEAWRKEQMTIDLSPNSSSCTFCSRARYL
jgi:RHS repeat-associated protein